MLGILKAAGAIGLLVGIGVPLIGTAAAVGLVLFFIGAIITHLRARDYSFGLAVVFLLLAVARWYYDWPRREPRDAWMRYGKLGRGAENTKMESENGEWGRA
jgi:hypothetical protein